MTDPAADRRRRLTHRAAPALGGLAVVSLLVGALLGSLADSAATVAARDFARAWQRGDTRAMYELLSPSARGRYDRASFSRAYANARATATATRVRVGEPTGEEGDAVRVPVAVATQVFGTVRGEVALPVEEDQVAWEPHVVFPGLPEGAQLSRRTRAPRRARLLSRDGKTLAAGPSGARSSPLESGAAEIAGRLEAPGEQAARAALYARGFPTKTPVGVTGLERIFERELAGRPGGELLAGRRVLARVKARAARAVRTTIDSRVQAAATTALAGRLGGVAALDARNGEIRALAGIAFSAPQPPGSTFKIATATAALEERLVKPGTKFPVETKAVIDGVDLANANGESCGGTFRASFAHSCNSVFAPLGVKLGARRLVAAAERYGFNDPPRLPGEAPSTLPPAREIKSPLEIGSTAIGQGKVLATPLLLASMAQTVAAGGRRHQPTLRPGQDAAPVRVTSRKVARTLTRFMVDVVGYGTATSAAIPGVKVAGKTGTAELEDTRGPGAGPGADPSNTDAWFTSFAPAGRPRVAVAVLLVRAGAGGQTAAPAAKTVLQAGLRR